MHISPPCRMFISLLVKRKTQTNAVEAHTAPPDPDTAYACERVYFPAAQAHVLYPQSMAYKTTPRLQTSTGLPSYSWRLIISGGMYEGVPGG